MSWSKFLTVLLVLAVSLYSGMSSAATVTFDLTSLGNLSLSSGQSQIITLGGSSTTVNGVTTTVSGLTITMNAFSAQGGIQSTNLKDANGKDVKDANNNKVTVIKNYNLHTTTGAGGQNQNVFQSSLNFSASGAGITNLLEGIDKNTGLPKDSSSIDGKGDQDFLEILLSGPATLTGVSFTDTNLDKNGNPKSQFIWMTDTNGDGTIGNGDVLSGKTDIAGFNAGAIATSYGGANSQAYGFLAPGGGDDWFFKAITFAYTPIVTITPYVPNPTPVPLPSSGISLLGLLVGMGVIMRRKRRSADG